MKNLLTLNPYLLKYKWIYLLGVFFIISSNFLGVFALKYVADALNELKDSDSLSSSSDALNQMFYYAGLFVALSIISGILTYFQRQTIIVSSRKIEYDLRNKIFNHYTHLPISFYKQNKIGDLMNRITEDVANVRMYVGPGIMYIINVVVMLIIISSFMFYYDWVLALVVLVPLPVLSILIYKVTRTIYKKSMQVQEDQSKVSSFVQDTFSGIRVLKSYAQENFIYNRYDKLTEKYKQSNLSLALTHSLFFPVVSFVVGLNFILVIYVFGVRYMNGHITFGMIGMFFLFVNKLIFPFISLGWIVSLIQKAEVSMKRVNEFLSAQTEEISTQNFERLKGKIEFRNVSYTYPNTGIKALENVSFIIEKGNTLAVFGKTGSGKSTLALLLTGLVQPDAGEIFIDNQSIKNYNLSQVRNSIGYIPQDAFLFSDTLFNNIAFGKKNASKNEVETNAHKADIHNSILDFNQKYDTRVGERGVTLSGGQKQRISIARALIKEAPILIFDDALSALDTETEETILNTLKQELEGKTTLIISHRVSSAKNADSILVLEEGKILEQGSIDEILAQKGYFYSLYEKQIIEK